MSLYNNINKTDNMENDLTRLTSAPGFRFHPTDEELVSYYLRRKLYGKGFRLDAISEVDVYKSEPWDLPGRSKLKTKDLEWYFFSALDKKYGNGVRTNRATEKGYWKTTGKDRAISHKSHLAGMKKTLVYHHGRAPKGQRTNWVMHEYRLIDEKLARAGVSQHWKLNSASSTVEDPYPWKSDAFVLCRIFQKSGPGPKNGEKYGAPLVDEEWEEDGLFLSPSKEVVEGTVEDHDIYLDSNDLEQIFGTGDNIPQPLNIDYGDSNVQVQKTPLEDSYPAPEKELQNPVLQLENQMVNKPLNQELAVGETSNTANDLDFLFDQEFFDALSNEPLDDAAFLENDDLFNMSKVDPSGMGMLDGYLNYFNEDQGFDYSNMFGSENLAAGQSFFNPELVDGGAKQEIMENQQLLQGNNKDDAFVSKPLTENVGSGGKYAFIEKASHMLGGISAPPALASEFPSKESALRLISASNPSVHLTAGMIQTKKLKSDIDVSFFLSFGVSHTDADNSLAKDTSAVSRSIMYFMFFSVLIISVTYRMGSWFFSGNISS